MDLPLQETLQEIGLLLDNNLFPRVKNGGFVVLSEPAVPSTLGTENDNDSERQRRSSAGSRSRPPRREGASGGPRSTCATAPVIGSGFQKQIEEQLDGLQEQYPGAQFWHQTDGIWLLVRSALLPRLERHAIFAVSICYTWKQVRSWGFWGDPVASPVWIGPRHTNYPDGSICAFEPKDGTWTVDNPIVQLLDIYSLWAFRHLYLEVFGRWPGRQAAHHPTERLLELRDNEYCGCAEGDELYVKCCKPKDLARNRVIGQLEFDRLSGGIRKPPDDIFSFVRGGKIPAIPRPFAFL